MQVLDKTFGKTFGKTFDKALGKVRYNRRTSPMFYWSHAPALWLRRLRTRRPLSPVARRVSDDLRATAVGTTSIDELAFPGRDRFWEQVDGLVRRMEPVTVGAIDGDVLDGRNTHFHCISIDCPQLAEEAPEVLMLGVDETVLDAIERYLGVPAALCDVHLRKDVGNGAQVGTRIWHLDTEDHRTVRMIVYLNDITVDDGPFEYLPLDISSSMPPEVIDRGLRAKGDPLLDEEMEQLVSPERWCQAIGPRGTVSLADNARLFHHGKAHESLRLAIFYTFTSRSPRYPAIRRSPVFDDRLSPRQRGAFFVDTTL